MKVEKTSFHSGEHIIEKRILDPLIDTLEKLEMEFVNGKSSEIRQAIMDDLQNTQGWSHQVKIQQHLGLTITSMNRRVGLCIQTGNMSRFYADLLKLQTLFLKDKINVAIYILPSKKAAKSLGDNITNSERFKSELDLFKHIITLPILVLAIE